MNHTNPMNLLNVIPKKQAEKPENTRKTTLYRITKWLTLKCTFDKENKNLLTHGNIRSVQDKICNHFRLNE